MLKIWTQVQYGSGEMEASDIPLAYVLGRPNDSSLYVNNTEVYHFDISCADPEAVLEFTIGRVSVNTALGNAVEPAQPNYFRGSGPVISDATISTFIPFEVGSNSPGLTEVLGQYYVTGDGKQADFADPIESLRSPGGAHAQAFAYVIARIDTNDSVPYHLNVWFDEY